MTPDRFERYLLTFGADLERWPVDERPAAKALLAKSAAFRASWERAGRLDALLRLDRTSSIAPARIQTITDGALRRIRRQEPAAPVWRWLFTKPVGAAFASAAIAGVLAVFVAAPLFEPPHPPSVSVVTFMLNGGLSSDGLF